MVCFLCCGRVDRNLTYSFPMRYFLITLFFVTLLSEALTIRVSNVAQIQDALNTVHASGGGTVLLEKGDYEVEETLLIGSNTTLKGAGNRESVLSTSRNIQILNQMSVPQTNMEINNLTFEGANNLNGGAIHIISLGEDHEGVRIIDVNAYHTGWGVHIKGVKGLVIDNCDFSRNGTAGKEKFAHNLYLRRVYGAVITDSIFNDSTSGNGINISYSEDIEIYHCEMAGNYFRGVRSAESIGYLVHNCYVADNGAFGIGANVERGFTTKEIDIQNNTVVGNAGEGIMIKNGSTGIVRHNNSYGNRTNYTYPSSVTFSENISQANRSLEVVEVESSYDTYTRGGKYKDHSYGSDSTIIVKKSSARYTRNGYIQFDVSDLETGHTSLTVTPRVVRDETDEIAIYGVSDNWDDDVTWSDSPTQQQLITTINFLKSDIGQPVSIDISDYVSSQIEGDGTVSLSLQMVSRGKVVSLYAKESGRQPVLKHSSFVEESFSGVIPTSADSYVRGGTFANANYGAEGLLIIKKSDNRKFSREAYLKFSLEGVRNVSKATLQIPVNKGTGGMLLRSVAQNNWGESQINWFNKPSVGSVIREFTVRSSDAGHVIEIDVTDVVESTQGDEVSFSLQANEHRTSGISFLSRESGNGFKLLVE